MKIGGHHTMFSVLEVKISKILQNVNKTDCFCLHTWFCFYGVSHVKNDSHNIWFSFVFGLFFEQSQLLNIIILGVYQQDNLNLHISQNKNRCSPKSDGWFYF